MPQQSVGLESDEVDGVRFLRAEQDGAVVRARYSALDVAIACGTGNEHEGPIKPLAVSVGAGQNGQVSAGYLRIWAREENGIPVVSDAKIADWRDKV